MTRLLNPNWTNWTNTEPTVWLWFSVGSVLVQFWFSVGSVLVQCWFSLVQCGFSWSSFGSVLVQCGFSFGLVWFSFGSVLVQLFQFWFSCKLNPNGTNCLIFVCVSVCIFLWSIVSGVLVFTDYKVRRIQIAIPYCTRHGRASSGSYLAVFWHTSYYYCYSLMWISFISV